MGCRRMKSIKTRKWNMIAIIILLLIFATVIILVECSTPQDTAQNILSRLGNTLGDKWKNHTVTEVTDLVYSDGQGNTIIYYVCVTNYYGTIPNAQTVLNTDAVAAVIDPDKAESYRECTISGLPAAIYYKNGRSYLCWTIIPELSCVIEYDPKVETEADMIRMAESVPANTSSIP